MRLVLLKCIFKKGFKYHAEMYNLQKNKACQKLIPSYSQLSWVLCTNRKKCTKKMDIDSINLVQRHPSKILNLKKYLNPVKKIALSIYKAPLKGISILIDCLHLMNSLSILFAHFFPISAHSRQLCV